MSTDLQQLLERATALEVKAGDAISGDGPVVGGTLEARVATLEARVTTLERMVATLVIQFGGDDDEAGTDWDEESDAAGPGDLEAATPTGEAKGFAAGPCLTCAADEPVAVAAAGGVACGVCGSPLVEAKADPAPWIDDAWMDFASWGDDPEEKGFDFDEDPDAPHDFIDDALTPAVDEALGGGESGQQPAEVVTADADATPDELDAKSLLAARAAAGI